MREGGNEAEGVGKTDSSLWQTSMSRVVNEKVTVHHSQLYEDLHLEVHSEETLGGLSS